MKNFNDIDSRWVPGGTFILGGRGLGPHIKFGGKIWGKVRPGSPNKRKKLGSSVTTRRKSWERIQILGTYLNFRGQNLGYLSLLFLEAKFGAPTRISEANFRAKPSRPPNIEVLSWEMGSGDNCQNLGNFWWGRNFWMWLKMADRDIQVFYSLDSCNTLIWVLFLLLSCFTLGIPTTWHILI